MVNFIFHVFTSFSIFGEPVAKKYVSGFENSDI